MLSGVVSCRLTVAMTIQNKSSWARSNFTVAAGQFVYVHESFGIESALDFAYLWSSEISVGN